MNLQKLIDQGLFPKHRVDTYDLGKHWPESGDYQSWLHKKLVDFQENYVYLSHETFSTNTGGTILYAKGVPKKEVQDYENGKLADCPECLYGASYSRSYDDVAKHLMEKHQYDFDEARIWLMEQVEARAFTQEP